MEIEIRLVRHKLGMTDLFCPVYEYTVQWRNVMSRDKTGRPIVVTNWCTGEIVDMEVLNEDLSNGQG